MNQMNHVQNVNVMTSTSTRKFMTPSSGKDQENNMDFHVRKRKREDSDVEPKKKTKVCNITDSTEPCHKSQESINPKKRRASNDGEMPGKKMRPSEKSVENNNTESSTDDSSFTLSSTESSSTGSSTAGSSTSGSSAFISSENVISHVFDNVSLEEQKIFEMASSGSTRRAEFEAKYTEEAALGSGGFGSVYSGFRKEDSLPVAIKHIPREMVRRERVVCNGKVYYIILEVAFMLKTAGLPGSTGQSAAISLLDWYALEHELILVLERPAYSLDLYKYLQVNNGTLSEQEAKMILRQLVDAAIDMHAKGVFHRDIKLENTLIQRSSTGASRLRVIDFGCGSFATEKSFNYFCGTPAYAPPEWFDHRTYWAHPTTVWQLGALFFTMLNGREYFTTEHFLQNNVIIHSGFSRDTKMLLFMCLARDPVDRATLQELQSFFILTEPSPPPV